MNYHAYSIHDYDVNCNSLQVNLLDFSGYNKLCALCTTTKPYVHNAHMALLNCRWLVDRPALPVSEARGQQVRLYPYRYPVSFFVAMQALDCRLD